MFRQKSDCIPPYYKIKKNKQEKQSPHAVGWWKSEGKLWKKDEVQHPYETSDCFSFAYYRQESKSLMTY